ncbi:MAG: DUF58 domain-containing protein [Candidatus Competibacteraceae bacterium]|nr:DUF58 domain-containing protein [Candidatus Competibacteraceae bacterium]MCP5126466.1 DUF58 domain-containing protein [Gammaproteobacteria bacterium]
MFDGLRQRFEAWVTRSQRPTHEPVRLERRRIYILPTRYGYGFAALLFVLFLWSINYSNSMGFAFTFLLVAVAHNSMWQAHDALLGLIVHPPDVEPVFVGQDAVFRFRLENPDLKPRYGVGLQWRDQPAHYVDAPASGAAVATVAIPATRRGWLRPGRIRVLTRFPLGLLQAWSWVEFEAAALIYPQPRGRRALPVALPSHSGGGLHEQGPGSEDYAGFRPYTLGDSPRRIAWKAASRSDQLLVKRFTDQARPELWLDWALLGDELVETRLAQLCQWTLKAESEGLRYGLRLPGVQIPPGQGDAHHRRCLEALALFGNARHTPSP